MNSPRFAHRAARLALCSGIAALALAAPAQAQQPFWESHGGAATLRLDATALRAQGLVAPAGDQVFQIEDALGSGLHFAAGANGRVSALFRGQLRTTGSVTLQRVTPGGAAVRFGDLCMVLAIRNDGQFSGQVAERLVTDGVAFDLACADPRARTDVNVPAQRFTWSDLEVRIAATWARSIGLPASAAGVRIGTLTVTAPITAGTSFYALGGEDCGCSVEPGATAAAAYPIPAPGRLSDGVDAAGDVDVFAVGLTAGQRYTFRTTALADEMDTILKLLAVDGTTKLAEDDDGANEGYASRLDFTATASGTHFLVVTHYNAQAARGTYELLVETTGGTTPGPIGPPVPAGDDHGDAPASATRAALGTSIAGRIGAARDQDWFSVQLAAGTRYTLRTGDLTDEMDTVLTLFGTDGTTQLDENDDAASGGLDSLLTFTPTAAGTYFLRVRHYDQDAAQGGYGLRAEADGAPTPPGPLPPLPPTPGRGYSHVKTSSTGPDVIVGDLHDLARYGRVNGVTAFSFGTTSCNMGTRNLIWNSDTNEHPVIGANLYRLKDGRMEQVGTGWLKHGFFALSENLCFNDCQPTDGTSLGVHCSDPYSAGLNGTQSNLGPKSEVDASIGFFPYPYTPATNPDPTLGLRVQVTDADLDPARNQGAMYYVEGHYVAADDSRAGNSLNNASTRRVRVTGSGTTWDLEYVPGDGTRRQKPAVEVWKDLDPDVALEGIDVAGDGHFDVACKVSRNANGTYHYEYAVYNMTSHRSARTFSVPVPAGAQVTNVGFHDIAYHSGEPYSSTDWRSEVVGGTVTWSTDTFQTNRNANALRWGTTYNFRFDCDRAPGDGRATLGLFRPGTAADPTAPVKVPGAGNATDTTAPVFAGAAGATSPTSTSVDVTWAAATDDRTAAAQLSYLVWVTEGSVIDYSVAPSATVTGVTGASVSNLRANVDYKVAVRARDAAGNVDRNTVVRAVRTTVQDLLAPAFSGVGRVVAAGPTSLTVEWTAATDDATAPSQLRYRVYVARAAGGQNFAQPTVTTSGGALSATVGGLTAGTRYFVVVRAVDAAGREDTNRFERDAETEDGIMAPAVEASVVRTSAETLRPGQQATFVATLRNTTSASVRLTRTLILTAPNGQTSRVGTATTVDVAAGATLTNNVTFTITATAAQGRYSLTAVYQGAGNVLDMDTGTFVVAPAVSP